MADTVIQVENLSKSYSIAHQSEGGPGPNSTLSERLQHAVGSSVRRLRGIKKTAASREEFWALRGLNCEIKRGETVGIIGRNGAGKSTFLKLLSRITHPTSGSITLRGRVASLLEVGTGFHPELTGRENVYLSGAILGMSRVEIRDKFDRIVDFAGISRFLDTPVKHYSSGMYVRLAFSVAAHLNPRILIVDEVLAVGDSAFQQKCLARMNEIKNTGATVLLVSHNVEMMERTCTRMLVLDAGQLRHDGDPRQAAAIYRKLLLKNRPQGDRAAVEESTETVSLVECTVMDEAGVETRDFQFGRSPRVRLRMRFNKPVECPLINLGLMRADGVNVVNFSNWADGWQCGTLEGDVTLEMQLPPLRLVNHHYEIFVSVWPWLQDAAGNMASMTALAAKSYGFLSIQGSRLNADDGIYQQPCLSWKLEHAGTAEEHREPSDRFILS